MTVLLRVYAVLFGQAGTSDTPLPSGGAFSSAFSDAFDK